MSNHSIFKKSMVLLTAVVMLATIFAGVALAEEEQVRRVAGADRYETSAITALDAFPDGAENVIIARGDDKGQWADGLAASYLSGVLDAPILLTRTEALPADVEAAIGTLEAENAYILGGVAAVSESVEAELAALDLEVDRVAGDDRYDTAALIADEGEAEVDTALVVSGRAPADSMVAGPRARMLGYPILLVSKDEVPEVTENAIQELGIENIYVVGGEAVVSDAVYGELADMAASITRLAGACRFETNIEFLKDIDLHFDNFAIVGGFNLADAVGVSAYPYTKPIIYVNSLPEVTEGYLGEVVFWGTHFTIFGGEKAVSPDMENLLQNMIDERTPEGGSFAHPDYLQVDLYDGEHDVAFDETLEVGLIVGEYLEEVSVEDFAVELHEGMGACDLAVTNVEPCEENPHHVHVTVSGVLNIAEEDWIEYWKEHGEWHPMLLKITSQASGHSGEDALYALVRIEPAEDIDIPEPPHFLANLINNSVDGFNWAPDTEISITIQDGDDTVVDETAHSDPEGNFEFFPGMVDYQLEPGHVITVDDGVDSSSHAVVPLSVEVVDAENDIVSGTAPVGSTVEVMVFDDEEWPHPTRLVEAVGDDFGEWSADFSVPGDTDAEGEDLLHDLQPGEYGHAMVTDEQGNSTVEYWNVPDPALYVVPKSDIVYGHDWDREAVITIKINGVEEATDTTDRHGNFRVEDLAVEAGDEVTVDDGVLTMTHVVTALEIIAVNWDTGVVQGTAEAGSKVEVVLLEPADGPGPPQVITYEEVEVDADGEWVVDFDREIVVEQYILASQTDENGNSTQARESR